MATIRYEDGIWWLSFPYDDFRTRDVVKRLKWRFHWGGPKCTNCAICKNKLRVPDKIWWTTELRAVQGAKDLGLETSEPAQDEMDRSIGLRRDRHTRQSNRPIPCPNGRKYNEYQEDCVAFCRDRRGTLIGDEMGLGKTIEAIACVNDDATVTQALVICPATLKQNWANEIKLWCARPCEVIIAETSDDIAIPQSGDLRWIIANPERLIKERANNLFGALILLRFDMLIVDEAHRVKNPRAATTISVLGADAKPKKGIEKIEGLINRTSRALFLTGTPMPNKPRELYPLLHALAPKAFPQEWPFLTRFCGAKQIDVPIRGQGMKKVWNFDGATNLDELRELMRSTIMIRRLKADVLRELPPKIRQVIPFGAAGFRELMERERAAFHELLELSPTTRQIAADLKSQTIPYEEAARRLQFDDLDLNGSSLAAVRQQIALAKLPLAFEHIRNLREDGVQKLVIFAHHHSVIDALAQEYGEEAVVMTGKTKMENRPGLVETFQESADKNVFIGGIKAAGVGITLTSAHTVVFVESDFVPSSITQAEDRVHRIGQRMPVLIQHLVIDGSVEAMMLKVAVAKQNIADRALDGGSRT